MPTRQQEVGAWLSIFSRGLGLTLGGGTFLWELGFDHLSHPIIIPSLVVLLGLGPLAEPVWKQILAYMLRSGRVYIQVTPWFRLEVTEPANKQPPPGVPIGTLSVQEEVVSDARDSGPTTP